MFKVLRAKLRRVGGWWLVVGGLILSLSPSVFSQQADSISVEKKSEIRNLKPEIKKHSPRKAAIYSAILPGLGQAYNKKYWKMPLVYAGFTIFGYFIQMNQRELTKYKKEYIFRRDYNDSISNNDLAFYTKDDLLEYKNYYQKNLEYTFVFLGLFYVLNIVDAYVDAHLLTFDISDDLSLNIQPDFFWIRNQRNFAGIHLTLTFH